MCQNMSLIIALISYREQVEFLRLRIETLPVWG